MSYYKAISAGNADTLAIWETWNGAAWIAAASLPTVTDDVYTNNNIVTVTTSQSYLSWNRSSVAAPLSITQGGQFQIDGANAITTQGIINGTNVNQGGYVSTYACVSRLSSHSNKLTHIGDCLGGGNNYAFGFWNGSVNDIDLIGNQIGGGANVLSCGLYNAVAATFSIIGDQIGGAGSTCTGIHNVGGAVFAIVGNQIGGGGGNGLSHGFYNLGPATFNSIVGNQVAVGTSSGFYNTQNITIPFIGNAYADGRAAIYNTISDAQVIYAGNVYNKLGVMAIYAAKIFLNVTPTTVWEFSDFGGNSQYLYGAGTNIGNPIPSDVRSGVTYDPNGTTTGTLAVPPPASVALNVPTDNTVGTLVTATTPADFIAALKLDDLGIRLGKCATTEEVDSTVAGYNT